MMRGFLFKTTIILSVTVLFGLQILAQPSLNDLLSRFFNNVRNTVVANADKLADWKNDAEKAAKKTIKDFTDCPSPAAQNLYNDLKNKLEKAREVKRQSDEAKRQAEEAREECKRRTNLPAQCEAAYNTLPFQATSAKAAATIASLEAAMKTLANLKCPSGCEQYVKVDYPVIKWEEKSVESRLPDEISYCSLWKRGSFWATWSFEDGKFRSEQELQLPKCERFDKLPICTAWDLNLLLPKLQKLNIVPPNVKVTDLKVEVPNKDVTVVSGIKEVNCRKPIYIAKNPVVTKPDFALSPLNILAEGSDKVQIGCADPPFGLETISNKVSVPDVARTRIYWNGITVKGGYIEIDMTRPELKVTCTRRGFPPIKVPTITVNKDTVTTNLCLKPRFITVVAKQ